MASGGGFLLAPNIARDSAMLGHAYRVPGNEPEAWRRLDVYAIDPSQAKRSGSIAGVRIPYEALASGPRGVLFAVDTRVGDGDRRYRCAELDDPAVLRDGGYRPDPADSRFHCQNVYAIAMHTYEAFRRALGRMIGWSFWEAADFDGPPRPLLLRPFGAECANAWFDRGRGEIVFGYVESGEDSVRLPAGKYLFSSLSADVIAHEVSHAILDGLRCNFDDPLHPDVFAFHEAFADLIALFQRFAFPDFLRAALRQSRADFSSDSVLLRLAPELARAGGIGEALRTYAVGDGRKTDEDRKPRQYDPDADLPPHEHGSVLTEAVFEAFLTIVSRKAEPLIELATGGTGILPPGRIPDLLLEHLVHVASRVAGQFRAICIRAIDYCPPVSMRFSDYLRAMITADYSLVKDDPYGYREALVDAFQRRNIYPQSVRVMSESTLLWHRPERQLDPVRGLGLSDLRFFRDPGMPAPPEEILRQATILGERIASDRRFFDELGLVRPDDPALKGDKVDLPVIASVRPARKTGPDGQIGFDLVAEVLQTRHLHRGRGQGIRGGATIILGPDASVRYVIRKSLGSERRIREDAAYLDGAAKRAAVRRFCVR